MESEPLCTADRIGLGASLFAAFIGLILMQFAHSVAAHPPYNFSFIWGSVLMFGVPIWVVCRIFDFIFGGPAQRAQLRQIRENMKQENLKAMRPRD